MEAVLTLASVLIGLYAGWRMLGRSVRAVWAVGVNAFEARRAEVTSSGREQQYAPAPVAHRLATTATTPANVIATPATDSNALLLRAKAEALAALVLAGKVGETEGIKLVYGVGPSSSNPRYLEARDALKAAMGRQAPPETVTPYAGRRTRAAFRAVEEFEPPPQPSTK